MKRSALAAGLWSAGSSEFLLDTQLKADLAKKGRSEGRPLVSDEPLDGYSELGEVLSLALQKMAVALSLRSSRYIWVNAARL